MELEEVEDGFLSCDYRIFDLIELPVDGVSLGNSAELVCALMNPIDESSGDILLPLKGEASLS